MADKFVYRFGAGKAEGRAGMKNLLGGKGANLAEMASLGLTVPPGFTITTEVCTHFYANAHCYPDALKSQVAQALTAVEAVVGAKFGDAGNPLLVSVRSGARVSMPGMESRAPERTATRRGMPVASPNLQPMIFSMLATPACIWTASSFG